MTLSSIAPLQSIQQTTALSSISGRENKTSAPLKPSQQRTDDTATFSTQGRRYAAKNPGTHSAEPKFTYSENGSFSNDDNSRNSGIDDKLEWILPFFRPFDEKIGETFKDSPYFNGSETTSDHTQTEFYKTRHLESEYSSIETKLYDYLHTTMRELGYESLRDNIKKEDYQIIEETTKNKLKDDPEAVQLMSKLGIDI